MTILDSLEAAEKAMAEKIDFDDMDSIRRITDARKEYDRLLDAHAAGLIAVARAALEFIYAPNYPKPGQKDERTQRAMAEDRLIVALDSLITSGGMKS